MVRAVSVGQPRQLGKEGAMPAEDNKQAVRRFYQEVLNAKNPDAIDELLTPDGLDHTFGSQNPEQAKQFFEMLFQAFPDLRVEVHDVIAEGELVAARETYSGTHPGRVYRHPRDRGAHRGQWGGLVPDG